MSFPVFSNGICIQGTIKGFDVPPCLQQPLTIGTVEIAPGDLMVGDRDGVVAIPAAEVAKVLGGGEAREADEARKIEKIRAGVSTLELYGFGEDADA
jgi:4-hydroxy-4-methyl-2-oxoglutarate aldolase